MKALDTLAADPNLRRRMGEAGRRVVAERYCIDVTAPRLAQLLREAGALCTAQITRPYLSSKSITSEIVRESSDLTK
jgi:hypothetical protein